MIMLFFFLKNSCYLFIYIDLGHTGFSLSFDCSSSNMIQLQNQIYMIPRIFFLFHISGAQKMTQETQKVCSGVIKCKQITGGVGWVGEN